MEQPIISNRGMLFVPQIAAVQYVYLDFDGELTSYNGEILTIDNVEVQHSELSEERINNIVAELNARYAEQDVIFVTERPTSAEYSTIFIGKTETFEPYGNFAGLAETIDEGNQVKNDNAFVMLDSSDSDESIIATIAHETDHLLGTLNHSGEGITAYACENFYNNTYTGVLAGSLRLSHNSVSYNSASHETDTNCNNSYYYYDSASNVTVNSGGWMLISSGGVANNTTVNSGGKMIIDFGVANNTTVGYGGYMGIGSGVASNTTVNSGGSMRINSGGVASNTTVNSGGYIFISGGTATEIVENGGYVSCWDRENVTFASNTINGFVLSSGHSMTVHKNTIASNTTINSGGYMRINSGGVANNTTVSGGSMYISSGVASNTTVNSGGYIGINSGGVANNTTVNSGGNMGISSGGGASNTTVNSGGSMYIGSGGEANNTTVGSDGYMKIHSGVASNTTVSSGGSMIIDLGGVASNTTVSSGGSMIIDLGVATEIVENGGYVDVREGANVTFASNTINGFVLSSGHSMTVHKNTIASNTTINSGGWMYIYSGGVASNTTVNYGGSMRISSGGVANNTTLSGGSMHISSGCDANRTTVDSGGTMTIAFLGVANSTTVNSGGSIVINSGGVANNTTVNYGGSMTISSGGVATGIVENGGYVGFANGTNVTFASNNICGVVLSRGNSMTVHKNTIASNTTINSGGYMYIYSGGVASNTTVNSGGSMRISSGGVANNTTLSGGFMHISSGGVHRGCLQVASGAVVSAYTGAKIDFTLTDRITEDGYLINNLALIKGTPTYTITVTDNQEEGIYKLAQGADNFTGTISIGNGAENYGYITINGDTFEYGSTCYSLNNIDGNLTLTVGVQSSILTGDASGITWNNISGKSFTVEYSQNNFDNTLKITTSGNAVDTYNLYAGTFQWRVNGINGENIVSDGTAVQQKFISDADGDMDLFFANANGKWDAGYAAEHQGFIDGWWGTGERVLLSGKNRLADIFEGSTDANILVMTDDAYGDALFVDDIYTALPEGVDAQARIAAIDEIRAGAGDDIIDLTSQRFEYVGDGVTVYGGAGNDTIWANSGENCLFGDAGNDRIVGGSDNDIIVGGAGNDRMHGGGGVDTFCFGENWGKDTVEQLADGEVILWFETGSEDFWNVETMTYSDGTNRVKVTGVSADDVTLKFGEIETAIAGAFDSFASEKIFEDQTKALLA